MKLRIVIFSLFLMLYGCSETEKNNKHLPGTPGVTIEQAKEIAYSVYNLKDIDDITLRVLNEDERIYLSTEQSRLTPVYYVITSSSDGRKCTVYISSNNVEHYFFIQN